jgi:HEPN domain-containing protein
MTNAEELSRWLKDAQACLNSARRDREAKDFRATVQNSQLVVELSAKGVIACFGEPEWSHDPSRQLLNIVDANRKGIEKLLDSEMINELKRLAQDTKDTAPWHGRAVYGRKTRDGRWVSAVDVCTEDKALWALELAERSFKTVSEFIEKWF